MRNKKVQSQTNPMPYRHENHAKPVTRRDFLAQGLIGGVGMAVGPSLLNLLGGSSEAYAAAINCNVPAPATGSGKVPFICFDLAGGANIAGSNVLVGKQGGQLDLLDAAGYSKLGIASSMLPSLSGQVDTTLGLAFHNSSSLLAGIKMKATPATLAKVDGCVICVRSNDDTGNNPFNPMYGIAKAGAMGSLVALLGTQNTVSGGNSVAPAGQIEAKLRPTKVSSVADTRGLVDTGKLSAQLGGDGAVRVMQAVERLSGAKSGKLPEADMVKNLLDCAYNGTTEKVQKFNNPNLLNPVADPNITSLFPNNANNGGINELADSEFIKTAAIMKLVIDGYAGAGTVQLGGFDYHDGNRVNGDRRDLKAGQAIGAVLEYARIKSRPVMIYVFTDGAVSSNGSADNNAGGKLVWTSDNGTCGAVLMLVYNPAGAGRPALKKTDVRQLGYYRASGSVETGATPLSNNVTQVAEAIVLNYLALHDDVGRFAQILPTHGLGPASSWDNYIAFQPIMPAPTT